MIFDLLAPPQGAGPKQMVLLHAPFHVSNSHNKFGWISSNGLEGDSMTDGRTEAIAISPSLFKKCVGMNIENHLCKILYMEDIYFFEVNTKYISLSVLKTSEFS